MKGFVEKNYIWTLLKLDLNAKFSMFLRKENFVMIVSKL